MTLENVQHNKVTVGEVIESLKRYHLSASFEIAVTSYNEVYPCFYDTPCNKL